MAYKLFKQEKPKEEKAVKTDCFAYKNGGCSALHELNCSKCGFYKPKGTECDTCHHKGTADCKKCHRG